MFQIENGREHFFQWDANQRLIISDASISEVHFYNGTGDNALVCEVYEENNKRLVNVPNILLQDSWDIRAYAYLNYYTKVEKRFKVIERAKPANYVYTETEVLNYNTLADRIDNVNNNIGASVEDYLTKNPVEVDLSNYALKSEIPDVSGFLTKVPDEYITETELDAKGYLTEHQSLAGYAKLTDIPDVSGYALKSEIPDVSGFITSIPDEYITDSELAGKGYALKSEIPTNVSAFNNDAGYLTEHQDLSGYALKTEIPDVSSYQTANQVNALIDAKLGVIENNAY